MIIARDQANNNSQTVTGTSVNGNKRALDVSIVASGGFAPPHNAVHITRELNNPTTEIWRFFEDLAGTQLLKTITIVYTDATLNDIQAVSVT